MIWIVITSLFISLLAWALLGPVIINLETETGRYQLALPGIFKAAVVSSEELFHIRGGIYFIPDRFNPFSGGMGKRKKKTGKPKQKKGLGFRSGNMQMIPDLVRSFRIRKLYLDIDSEDFMLNAWLVPAFSFINSENIQMRVNFHGTSSLVLDLRTRLGLLLWTVIRNKYRSFF